VELSDLKGDSYAESLIQTINSALAAKGGKIEAIQDLLLELLNKLNADQKTADSAWDARYRSLNKTISDTQALIDRLWDEITKATKKRADLNALIVKGEANLKQYASQLSNDKATLQQLHIKRNSDHNNYKENVSQHQNLILALEAVIKALTELRGSVSAGRPTHVGAITEEIRDEAWRKKHPALLEIFTDDDINMFVQVATEADQDSLDKLIGMLNDLVRSTRKSLADDQEAENESVRVYNQLVIRLNTDIGLLNTAITKQNANLKSYRKTVNELTIEINTKTDLRNKNIKFRDQTIEIRRQEKLKYEEDTRHRNYERTIINKLRKIVDEKLAKMKEFLRAKVN